jgi:hypothetical protein
MDQDTFWEIIDKARPRNNDAGTHSVALVRALKKQPAAEIGGFDQFFWNLNFAAYRRDLWDVALAINGLCSDDGFAYVRWWLVMQGRDVYELALADPESLAELSGGKDDLEEGECYASVAGEAYLAVTGEEEIPDEFRPTEPYKLKGRSTSSEKGFRRKYPMLSRLLRDPPKIDASWLKWGRGTVKRLAKSIHAERKWSELPVLADAMEEAGCADEFLLGHLRAGRRHARSCWVTHLLLKDA